MSNHANTILHSCTILMNTSQNYTWNAIREDTHGTNTPAHEHKMEGRNTRSRHDDRMRHIWTTGNHISRYFGFFFSNKRGTHHNQYFLYCFVFFHELSHNTIIFVFFNYFTRIESPQWKPYVSEFFFCPMNHHTNFFCLLLFIKIKLKTT